MNKKGRKTAEKLFRPAFGCCKHPKADRNTQQVDLCPVVKWLGIQMVVWKPDLKKPVYGSKCPVYECHPPAIFPIRFNTSNCGKDVVGLIKRVHITVN